MNLGDCFPEGKTGMFGTDTPMRLLRLIHQLSKRFEGQDERFELLKAAITYATESIYTIDHEVAVLGQEHGKLTTKDKEPDPEEQRTVNSKQLEELEKLACNKIRDWAADGRLKDHPKLVSILYSWRRWCPDGEEAVSQFVTSLVESEHGLIQFIQSFLGKTYSQTMGVYVSRVNWRIDLKSIDAFLSVEKLTPRLRSIVESSKFKGLPEDAQRALQTYIDTVDGKVEQ